MPIVRVIRQIFFPEPASGFLERISRPLEPNLFTSGDCSCASLVSCPSAVDQIQLECSLPDGDPGVCCPPATLVASASLVSKKVFTSPNINVQMKRLNSDMVNAACDKGLQHVNNISHLEDDLIRNNIVLPLDSPASVHLRVFKTSKRAKRMNEAAATIVAASSNMLRDFSLTPQQGGFGLRGLHVQDTLLGSMCPRRPSCDPNSKYRTPDGSCNNLKKTTWGKSNTPCQRILAPTYDDG
ncbi:hypothetical protein OTU49_010969, partial [Cherax quadricarinatus]